MAGISLWEARGRVREVAPRPEAMVNGFLNRRVRNVVDMRTWSDLIRMGMIVVPAQYNTGTISLTSGSNQVVGTATAWPINDAVNTVLAAPINDSPGFVEIQPASMTGIYPGVYILLDQGTPASTEIISVQSVKGNKFVAYCQYPHAMAMTLQKSSLAGLQLSAGGYIYTVQAVTTALALQIDMQYGGAAQTNIPYFISAVYVKPMASGSALPSSTARRMLYAYDAIAGEVLGVNKTAEWLALEDPQMQNTGDPEELVAMAADPGGSMQWTLWPLQTSAYGIGVVYQDGWPVLRQPNDMLPPFLNPEIFIAGAIADCLRARVISNDRQKDPYYDPQAAQYWENEFATLTEAAVQSDQGRYMTHLKTYTEQISDNSRTYNWMRAHAVSVE